MHQSDLLTPGVHSDSFHCVQLQLWMKVICSWFMQIALFSFEQSTMQSFAQCGRQAQLLIWNTLFTSSLSALQDPPSQDSKLSLTQLQILLSHIIFFHHEINLFSYCWVDVLQCFMHLIIPLCILLSIKHTAQHLRLVSASE